MNPASPDDIRAAGWAVAVHNDYRLHGESYTFWLFTKGERAVKGEGKSDSEALDQVRERIKSPAGSDDARIERERIIKLLLGMNEDEFRRVTMHYFEGNHKGEFKEAELRAAFEPKP